MQRRDLKNQIKTAFEQETPNMLSHIQAAVADTEQVPADPTAEERPLFRFPVQRVVAVALCILLFASGLTVGIFMPGGEGIAAGEPNSTVYLDVNPSIELQMGEDQKILACVAGNDDAETVLADLELQGVKMHTAVKALVGSLYLNGYLKEDTNAILVSVESEEEDLTQALLSDVTEQIQEVMGEADLPCEVISQDIHVNKELKQMAEDNGVSVGKMKFVQKLIEEVEELESEDISELLEQPIRDLNKIRHEDKKQEKEEKDNSQDKNPGSDGKKPSEENDAENGENAENHAWLTPMEAYRLLLDTLDVKEDKITWYEVKVKWDQEGTAWRYVFSLTVTDGIWSIYTYEMDAATGELLTDASKPADRTGK